MLYEFRGLPRMEGFQNNADGELSRIRASEYEEDCGCGEEERYCGFCGRRLIPDTEDFHNHCHGRCSI